MADYHHHERKNYEPSDIPATPAAVNVEESAAVEVGDRGLFDFLGKKKEEKQGEEEVIASDFEEKVQVCKEKKEEPKEEETKYAGLFEKLHRTSSSSGSSSSEEEAVEGGEKKKKKKGLKEKIKEKLSGENNAEGEGPTNVHIEKYDDIPASEPEQKKSFFDKIKEKLPGGKKTEEATAPTPKLEVVGCATVEGKEKKGFLIKIKEKIPGYNAKSADDKGKEEACN
ncbi:uncharacterized protein LOC142533958 [Primulina tabacum]|uniref:uncharacterized protein LOC142533958 n=1 Tax=Primulina tabacum TaxID=48773 RepID=UPI003F5A572D